ncbi:hypothetical protein BZG36_03566 [Bifiguratus adelaidae]|uniref:Uncharacterized protein n=1 Tax=Bifiguratus adelaidae TaxID=1938954 RepID=A0A261Y0A4_9FUNG|nr:hypothetical protein BZG36_03566 [Bifiguratus adelaidae]
MASISRQLCKELALPESLLDYLEYTGPSHVLPSSFQVTLAAQASIGTCALAASYLHHLRGAFLQHIRVNSAHACAEFRSERYLRVNDKNTPELWDKIAGNYPCKDRYLRLHTNFEHHRDGVLRLLECDNDRQAVAEVLKSWEAFEFEELASQHKMVVAAMRSMDEWKAHPQGKAIDMEPLVAVEQLTTGSPRVLPLRRRPLSGIRVLDLTRIIAGPVCGRALAAHGADVLLVTSPNLPFVSPLVIDTGRGKRSCYIDLKTEQGKQTLESLIRDADVLIQGYRPHGIADLGFSPQRVAELNPNIVYVSLTAYGYSGPWQDKRGFDSLVQMTTGISDAEGKASGAMGPRQLPAQVLDHASGYLMALGAITALARRTIHGGTYHVKVSLAKTSQWLQSLGRLDQHGFDLADPTLQGVTPFMSKVPSGFGTLFVVNHAAEMEVTPCEWTLPSVPLGTHSPAWI